MLIFFINYIQGKLFQWYGLIVYAEVRVSPRPSCMTYHWMLIGIQNVGCGFH